MAIRKFIRPSSLDSKLAAPTATPSLSSTMDVKTPDSKTTTTTISKSEAPKGGVTYAFQDKLPELPIPALEDTCQRYLDSLRPLQLESEHGESKVAVKEFLKYDGPNLQEKLKQYAEGKSNYIEQFCISSCLPSSEFLLMHSRVRLISQFRQSSSAQSQSILST